MVDRSELVNDPETAMRQMLEGHQAKLFTTFPGIIQSVNMARLTCTIQPAIQAEVSDEFGDTEFIDLPVLLDCPIQFPSGGGFIITFPLAVNDEVLVSIANRCIDSWWQNGGVQPPAEFRMHDLSDGFALPGIYSLPNVPAGLSTTDLEIRKEDGSAKIIIKANGEIDLVSPSLVKLTAPAIDLHGNTTVHGTLTDAGGIGLASHKHLGVTPGGGSSGVPTP